MNPISNPYVFGSGQPPPLLAGRAALCERVRIGLARLRVGRSTKGVLMVGLRGVGKSVLLQKMRSEAEAEGVYTLWIDDPDQHSLPALLAPQLRLVLLRLRQVEPAKDAAGRVLQALAGFSRALEGALHDRLVDLDFDAEAAGLACNGQVEDDAITLLEQTGMAVKLAGSALVLFIDECQCIDQAQLSSLIGVLHRCAQLRLPVTVVGAGLPTLRGLMGDAKAYAERLFDFPGIGPLSVFEAALAIVQPAEGEGAGFEAQAVDLIVAKTQGYPLFLQALASHAWDLATGNVIAPADVERASYVTLKMLDEGYFRVQLERLTPMEKHYLRAMAELGPGPHRSGEIAERQGRRVQAVAPVRNSLIGKGLIWSPEHGDTAFTVPFFDEFMRRIMPELTGR